jgi:putative glycosyltransferase ytcC
MNQEGTIAIITTGLLPVPSVMGGAVENLVQNFIDENERQGGPHLTVYSTATPDAIEKAQAYTHTDFVFIQTPWVIRVADSILYSIFRRLVDTNKSASLRAILQRLYFLRKVSKHIARKNHRKILFENAIIQTHILRWHKNQEQYKGRVYVHIHNEITNFYKTYKYLVDAKIIVVSKFIKDSLIAKSAQSNEGSGPLQNVSVLKNAVDNTRFTAMTRKRASKLLHQQYAIDASKKIVLFSGRLTPEKGIDVLLRALDRVKEQNYQLLVVGSSFFGTDIKNPFLKELRDLTEAHREHVTFTGYIDYDNMPLLYRGCDFAVLPSVCNDAAPLTVIESITAGLPMITTNRGGIPEYASDRAAILLDTDENLEQSIAKNIEKLLREDDTLQAMSKAGQKAAKDMTLYNYYRGLLEKLGEK